MSGNPNAFGRFSGGEFGIDTGIILSTGKVCTAAQGVENSEAGVLFDDSKEGFDFAPEGAEGDRATFFISFEMPDIQRLTFECAPECCFLSVPPFNVVAQVCFCLERASGVGWK